MSKITESVGRTDLHWFRPDQLLLVTDPKDVLYDERVNQPLDENMVKNVMACGILEPVLIRRDGEQFKVVAGRQRVRWALEANKRLAKEGKETVNVPCKLERITDDVALGILISENECRTNDDPLIQADKLARFMAMGKTEAEAAVTFAKPAAYIKALLKLGDCSPKVRSAIKTDKISVSAAGKLSELSREDQDKSLEELTAATPPGKKATFNKVYTAVQTKKGGKTGMTDGPTKREVRKFLEDHKDSLPQEAKDALSWVLDGKKHRCILSASKEVRIKSMSDINDETLADIGAEEIDVRSKTITKKEPSLAETTA